MKNVTYSEAKRSDINEITKLFRNTIQTVNKDDYSAQEIIAWSNGADVTTNWIDRIDNHYFLIAKIDTLIVGMASITDNGYLDVIYVHPDYQGQRLASTLLSKMITRAKDQGHTYVTSDVSITAKPFFLYKGFKIVQPQLVLCRGVVLRNYNVRLEL